MTAENLPCGCSVEHQVLIQYPYNYAEHIDGWSELMCEKCKRRWGRWTKKELEPAEREPRYGGVK